MQRAQSDQVRRSSSTNSLADSKKKGDQDMLFCCGKKNFLHRITYVVAVIDVILIIFLCHVYFAFVFEHPFFESALYDEDFLRVSSIG